MDNQNPKSAAEKLRAERRRRAAIQSYLRLAGILLAIVLAIASLCISCSTRKAVQEVAEQLAVKKAALAQEEQLAAEAAAAEEQAAADAIAAGTQVTLSFIGDVTICSSSASDYENSLENYYDTYGASYFFENVRSILEGDDLTVANLECCITNTVDDPAKKSTLFRADPSYATILMNSGIDAASTDNDHTVDYDDAGYVDTLANLDIAGITRFGGTYTSIVEVNGISIGLSAINVLDDGISCMNRAVDNVTALKQQGAQIIICSFHWGSEGTYAPTQTDVELAHAVIDAGADMVVASHPKVLQGIELYHGKYICYSLGSFCYGGRTSVDDADTMIFRQTFTVIEGEVQDNAAYEIIPCLITSSGSSINNYSPMKCGTEDAERILTDIYDMSAKIDGGITREPAQTTAAPAATVTDPDADAENTGNADTEAPAVAADPAAE